MKNKIGRPNTISYVCLGIVSLIIGVILITNSKFTLTGLCSVFATMLILSGAIMMVRYFLKAEYQNHQSSEFAMSLFMILTGVVVMVRKEDIGAVFPQFLAIYVMLSGVLKMQQAMDLLGIKDEMWTGHFFIGLFIVILSGIVLLFPEAAWFKAKDRIPLYLCILLIVDGILNLGCLVHANNRKKRYLKTQPDESRDAIEDKKAQKRRD